VHRLDRSTLSSVIAGEEHKVTSNYEHILGRLSSSNMGPLIKFLTKFISMLKTHMRWFVTPTLHHALSIISVDFNNRTLIPMLSTDYNKVTGIGRIQSYEKITPGVKKALAKIKWDTLKLGQNVGMETLLSCIADGTVDSTGAYDVNLTSGGKVLNAKNPLSYAVRYSTGLDPVEAYHSTQSGSAEGNQQKMGLASAYTPEKGHASHAYTPKKVMPVFDPDTN